MSVFACGRCAACDGEKGHEFCERPLGPGRFVRCKCGRVWSETADSETLAALEALEAACLAAIRETGLTADCRVRTAEDDANASHATIRRIELVLRKALEGKP